MNILSRRNLPIFCFLAFLLIPGCNQSNDAILSTSTDELSLQKHNDDDDDDKKRKLKFKARLSGDNELPPVATETRGKAEFRVNSDQTKIRFKLQVRDGVGILGAAGAHIHCGVDTVNGPIVAFLAANVPGGFNGDLKVEGTLTEANITNEACGTTIAELVQSFKDGEAYVNVHSTANPSGEVRGQIVERNRRDRDRDDDDDDDD